VTPPSSADLLAWYDRHGRTLPWRDEAAGRDPYRVWLSEVMLQQTTVATVTPRYARFLARFPDVGALASAPWEDVAEEWAGLGYYARARNLHAGAKALAGTGFPDTIVGLRALPGIGPYTAAAVAAIAFNIPVVPTDGNVERVTARLYKVEDPLPAAKPRLTELAQGWVVQAAARARPGDFAQALFDLGARICTPRNPTCSLCPWMEQCAARRAGVQAELPRKAAKPARPTRYGTHFCLLAPDGGVLVRRRAAKGLLGGMLELPGTPWRDLAWPTNEAMHHAPVQHQEWRPMPGEALHGFTHFQLRLKLFAARLREDERAPAGYSWIPLRDAPRAMPTAMKKLLALHPADGIQVNASGAALA